ncbi:double C2-like [Homalodisca vitripennis]|nr:double C2-like [Homalodisca vitripennis]
MKRNAIGSGTNQCILCGAQCVLFGVLSTNSILCHDCRKTVCQKCGVETCSGSRKEVIWRCKICAETREMWKKTGAWFFKAIPKHVLPVKKPPMESRFRHGSRIGIEKGTWSRAAAMKSSELEEESSSDDDRASRLLASRSKKIEEPVNHSQPRMSVLSKGALLYCQVFIGFPLKYVPESATVTRLVFSPTVFWWGLIVSLLGMGSLCFEFYMRFKQNPTVLFPDTDFDILSLALSLIYGSSMMMLLTLSITYAIKYPKFQEVCNFLETFDHNMELGTPEYCNTVNLPIIVLSTVTPITFEVVNQCLRSLEEDHELIFRRIMLFFYMSVTLCGRTGILVHFQQVTFCMAKRFSLLNIRIKLEVISENVRQSILRRNRLNMNLRQDRVSCKKVELLMSAYHLLCDAMQQANDFYCDLLLASIFFTFISITESLYFLFRIIAEEDTKSMWSIAAYVFSNASFLMLITLSGSRVSEAAGETASLTRKLINQDLSSELREELKSFLLQLWNQNVEFSAGGFFQINKETLTSMVATVTTFLVIMIQFGT